MVLEHRSCFILALQNVLENKVAEKYFSKCVGVCVCVCVFVLKKAYFAFMTSCGHSFLHPSLSLTKIGKASLSVGLLQGKKNNNKNSRKKNVCFHQLERDKVLSSFSQYPFLFMSREVVPYPKSSIIPMNVLKGEKERSYSQNRSL